MKRLISQFEGNQQKCAFCCACMLVCVYVVFASCVTFVCSPLTNFKQLRHQPAGQYLPAFLCISLAHAHVALTCTHSLFVININGRGLELSLAHVYDLSQTFIHSFEPLKRTLSETFHFTFTLSENTTEGSRTQPMLRSAAVVSTRNDVISSCCCRRRLRDCRCRSGDRCL